MPLVYKTVDVCVFFEVSAVGNEHVHGVVMMVVSVGCECEKRGSWTHPVLAICRLETGWSKGREIGRKEA